MPTSIRSVFDKYAALSFMKYSNVDQGFVTKPVAGSPTAVAAGPRCALTDSGQVACSFMVQSELGRNDFQARIVHSNDDGKTWSPDRPIWPELVGRYSVFGSISRGH